MTSSIDGLNRDSSFSRPEKVPSQGKFFYKISDAGKYIIHSINNVAQSILSKCIYVASFGKYNLDNLKNYLFSDQAPARLDSSTQPTRPAPPPPLPPPLPLVMPVFEHASGSSNSTYAKPNATPAVLLKEATYAQTYNDGGFISIEDLPEDEEVTAHISNARFVEDKKPAKDPSPSFFGITKDNIKNLREGLKRTNKNKIN